jgi:hypothetical protein
MEVNYHSNANVISNCVTFLHCTREGDNKEKAYYEFMSFTLVISVPGLGNKAYLEHVIEKM